MQDTHLCIKEPQQTDVLEKCAKNPPKTKIKASHEKRNVIECSGNRNAKMRFIVNSAHV